VVVVVAVVMVLVVAVVVVAVLLNARGRRRTVPCFHTSPLPDPAGFKSAAEMCGIRTVTILGMA
jgi:hypothetical protein